MEQKECACVHNDMVTCDRKECWNCGWNPVVKAKRMRNWKRPETFTVNEM